MKKLVLGIVSVFLTQLIFVAYNWTGDELAADVGRVSEYRIEPEQWPIIRNIRPPYPETIATVTENVRETPSAFIAPTPKLADHRPAPRVAKRNTFKQNDLRFEPTVITYSTVPVKFTERPQIASVPAMENAKNGSAQPLKKQKRSLIQKTGSVIKKPFVWLKNLVAKND